MRNYRNPSFLRFENRMEPQAGRLLVANPFLPDNNFKRAVVLLVEHNDEGSVGFVLNRSLDLRLNDVVNDLPPFDAQLFYGGPVQVHTLHFVHTSPAQMTSGQRVADGLFWGGNYEQLSQLIKEKAIQPADFRFFVGYAGWSAGQLQTELEENAWVVAPATREVVLEQDPDRLWNRVMEHMGEPFAVMARFPADPRLN